MNNEAVMVFIDGNNLYHGLKHNIKNTRIDIEKFSNTIIGDRRLVRTYYYNALLDHNEFPEDFKNQKKFLDSLKRTPNLSIKLGRLEKKGSIYIEKGVEINLAVDILTLAFKGSFDTCVIVTGDADYVNLVREVKSLGKRVEIAFFKLGTSQTLINEADRFIILDNMDLSECLFPNNLKKDNKKSSSMHFQS